MTHNVLKTRMDTITTITFDGDDTLWDFRSAMWNALEITLRELRLMVANHAADALTVQRMAAIREAVADELDEGVTTVEAIRYAALGRTLAQVGDRSEAGTQRLFEVYNEARFAGTRPYPGVADVLTDLKNRYQIGLVSNGNTYPERIGLTDIFSFVLLAQECGFAKPDRRIFEIALSKCGGEAEQAIHIGDSLQHDILGANRCGIRSVWLNQHGALNETGVAPDYEISDLRELLEFL